MFPYTTVPASVREQILRFLNRAATLVQTTTTRAADGTLVRTETVTPVTVLISPVRSISDMRRRNEQVTPNIDYWVYLPSGTGVQVGDAIITDSVRRVVVFRYPDNGIFQIVGVTE